MQYVVFLAIVIVGALLAAWAMSNADGPPGMVLAAIIVLAALGIGIIACNSVAAAL